MKKYTSLFLAVIILFIFLVGCTSNSLLLEKDNAQKELQNYVQEKLTGNYSSENSSKIQLLFQEGIENIQKAENSADISRALATTKAKLDEIKEEDKEENKENNKENNSNTEIEIDSSTEGLISFVNSLELTDVLKIEYLTSFGTGYPQYTWPMEKITSTLQSDFATVYQWLKGLTFEKSNEETVEGGGAVVLKVFTTKGTFQIANADGENFFWCYGERYTKHASIPTITGDFTTCVFSSQDTYCYLTSSDFKISKDYQYDFSEVECKRVTDNIVAGIKGHYRCQTPIGMLYLYNAKCFERNGEIYVIVNDFDFSQIFNDFPNESLFIDRAIADTLQYNAVSYGSSFHYEGEYVSYPNFKIINTYEEYLAEYPDGKDGYDEKFFEDNFLLTINCFTSHSAVLYLVERVYQSQEGTIIRLYQYSSGEGAAVVGEYYVTMEFSKDVQINQSTTYVTVLHPI